MSSALYPVDTIKGYPPIGSHLSYLARWDSAFGARGHFAVIVPSYDLFAIRRGLDWRTEKRLDPWDMLAQILEASSRP